MEEDLGGNRGSNRIFDGDIDENDDEDNVLLA